MARRKPNVEKAPVEEKAPRRGPKPAKRGVILSGVPRVNLLPLSEVERRATRTLLKGWVIGALATAVIASGIVGAANWMRAVADSELAAEEDRTLELNTRLAEFSDVSRALAERGDLASYRTVAAGNDVGWREFLRTLLAAVPADSELRDFNLTVGANPAEGADPATAVGVIGRLTLATTDARDVARMVAKLRELDITLAADTGSLSSAGEDGYTYTVDVVVNQGPYSGRFADEAGA